MRILRESKKSTELDEVDLKTIRAVFDLVEEIRKTQPHITSIVCFRGPETAETFADVPESDLWSEQFPQLGEWAEVYGSAYPSNPGKKVFRHVERHFVGSPVFPRGIPIGTYDNHNLAGFRGSSYKLQNTTYDVSLQEREVLEALAYGKKYYTPEQGVAIRKARAEQARAASNAGNDGALKMLAQVMAAVTGMQKEQEREERITTAKKATEK